MATGDDSFWFEEAARLRGLLDRACREGMVDSGTVRFVSVDPDGRAHIEIRLDLPVRIEVQPGLQIRIREEAETNLVALLHDRIYSTQILPDTGPRQQAQNRAQRILGPKRGRWA